MVPTERTSATLWVRSGKVRSSVEKVKQDIKALPRHPQKASRQLEWHPRQQVAKLMRSC